MVSTKLIAIIIIIAGIAVFLSLGRFYNWNFSQASFAATLLNAKPALSEQFIKNPDIIYSSFGWLSVQPENLIIDKTVLTAPSNWIGNGYVIFSNTSLDDRYGIILLPPISNTTGRFIEQSTTLEVGNKYILNFGIADVADILVKTCKTMQCAPNLGNYSGNCADVGFKVTIADNTQNKVAIVFNQVIRNGKWYDYSIDLGSTFNGDSITVKLESYAADGGCGLWNGEWAAIDYLAIAKA